VILKHKDSPEKTPKAIENEDYLILETKGWLPVAFEANIKNKFKFRGIEERLPNKDLVSTLKMAQYDAWTSTLSPFEDVASLVMKPDGKMRIVIHNSNTMKKYSGVGKTVSMQYIGMFASKTFAQTLGLNQEMVGKLTRLMQTAMITYFSSTECNGKQVHEQFIKGEFEKKDIVEVLLKVLKFPTSKEFNELTKDLDIGDKDMKMKLMKTLKKNKDKNILDMFSGVVEDVSNAPEADKTHLIRLREVLTSDKSFNVFEKEFFVFVQQAFNELRRVVLSQEDFKFEKLNLSFMKYVPAQSKQKVTTTLRAIFNVLKTWKYDVNKAPQENVQVLVAKLDKAKAFDLLHLDHTTILARAIIDQSKLPNTVEVALKNFLKNLNHVELVSKISKFALQSFKVPAPHKPHITKLMNSKTVDEYFKVFASTIHKKGKMTADQKRMVKRYLDTQDKAVLFKTIKDMLRKQYGVSEIGLEFLETITRGDMTTFKNLPTIYSVNFFPKMAQKVMENLKNLNLPGVLQQLNGFIKDDDVKQALKGILENKENLDEIPAVLLKLAMKKAGDEKMNERDKKVLKEVNIISMKFLAIALGKEQDQGKIIKGLVIQYYRSVYTVLKNVLPEPLQPVTEKLYQKVLQILQSVNTKDFNKDATNTLVQTTEKVSQAIVKFVDENFEQFIKEDLMKSLKQVMQQITVNEGKDNLWDLKEK